MSKYPSKRKLKIVVGFDTVRKTVKFLSSYKLEFSDAEMLEFSYTQQFLSDEFMEEFKQICTTFVQARPSNRQMACYLSLPNLMVTMDNVSLPQMRRGKLNSALQSHLQNLYKNYKDLQFNSYTVSSNKKQTTFYLTIIRRTFLDNLYRAMAENRLYSKGTSFTANCTINSVLQFKPNYRKKNFIFLDIHSAYTNVSVCFKGRTAGFCTLLLGTDHLADDEVFQEDLLYRHEAAELAITNAKERAQSKRLTMQTEEDSAIEEADDEMDAEEEKIEQKSVGMRKRLPKFMLRPEPTDPKGYIYENFRMFIKWAFLYRKQLQSQEYLPPVDCVLVNLPQEYSFVIDMANAEEEGRGLPFEYFNLSENQMVMNNLDMIGALYCGAYNKKANF